MEAAEKLAAKPFEYEKDLTDAKEEAGKISKELEAEANKAPVTGDISDEEAGIISKYDGEEDQNESGTRFSLSSPKFLVTNKNITGDTRVKVVDVTGNTDKLNVFDTSVKTRIKNLLEGKIFRIEESELYSKSRGDSGHFTASQNKKLRNHTIRRKVLSNDDSILAMLGNAIYVERYKDRKAKSEQGKPVRQFIDCFAAIRDGDVVYPVRIVVEDSDTTSGKYQIKKGYLYDFYPHGHSIKKSTASNVTEAKSSVNGVESSAYSTIRISEILTGVKDRNGKPFVNEDGTLNYEPVLFILQTEQNRKYTEAEIEDSIKKAFPTATVTKKDDLIFVSLPNGHKVEISITDVKVLTAKEAAQASKDYEQKIEAGQAVQGSMKPKGADAFMTLDANSVEGTIDHETLHDAMATVLTPKEKSALLK